jgi:hypothetical protein
MPSLDPAVAYCLKGIGRDAAGWDAIVVSGRADTAVRAEDLWAVWTDLERWPAWSPLHLAVTRTSRGELAAGSTFDQQIGLGFPVGTKTEPVTIDLLEPARRVSWSGDANGVKSCHLWSFTRLPDGGTHVSNVEAFAGLSVGLVRLLVHRRWNRAFQSAVDGLIRRTVAATEAPR